MHYGAMNFPVRPVLDEINTIARSGFDYLELAMDPPMAHYNILSSSRAAIIRALKDNGLGLVCHLPTFLSTADLTDSIRRASIEEMRQSLQVAADLGAKKVVLHPSMVVGMGGFVMDSVKEFAYDFLCIMLSAATQLDMTICLENMMPRNMLGVEPDDLAELFRELPALKLALDTGHANIGSPEGDRLQELIRQFGHRLGHLHFSDNRGYRDDHLPVGKGSVNFSRLLKGIKASGYNDTLTLEVFTDDHRLLIRSRNRIKELLSAS